MSTSLSKNSEAFTPLLIENVSSIPQAEKQKHSKEYYQIWAYKTREYPCQKWEI